MRPVLIVTGAFIALFGLVGLVFGLEISDIERGQTQAICGAVALTGGILIIASGLVLGRLKEISERLAALGRLPSDAAARMPGAPARPAVSSPAAIFGDASRAWQDEAAAAGEAPVPAEEPLEAPGPAEPVSTIPGRLAAFSRPRSVRKPAATTDTPRAATAAEVAAAAVAAAISLPEAGLAEIVAERPEPEAMPGAETLAAPATPGASEPEPASEAAEEASEAPAPVGGLWKLKQTTRTFERFSLRQQPEGPAEPIQPAAGEPAPAAPSIDLPAEPAETVAAATPGADQTARSRFPMRSMTLPRGNWPDPPARGEAGVPVESAPAAEPAPAPASEETVEAVGAEAAVEASAPAEAQEPPAQDFEAPLAASAAEAAAEPAARQQAEPPAHEATPDADAREEAPSTAPELEVIGRYESNGATYVMYADGSIDAETETGVWRFGSLDELKAYIEAQAG